jgi:uncharacterized protein involved in exopolysaccharide biosynthesis
VLQTETKPFASRQLDTPERGDLELWALTSYIGARWRVFVVAFGIAIPLVLMVSLLMPKKYSATSSLLIDPPAGNDPRGSTAISPIYLESLKTYEHFASSDSLFEKALDNLGLRASFANASVEQIKRRVLEITKPRDTKVLEIKATLNDPVRARDMARYIAQATVEMSRSLDRASGSDLTEGGDAVLAMASKRLTAIKAELADAVLKDPIAGLEGELGSGNELKSYLMHELSSAETELAAYQSRSASGKQGPPYMDSETAKEAVAAARAQVESLTGQLQRLTTDLVAKANLLEQRRHRRQLIEKELAVTQQQVDTATNHRNEVLESLAFRGERLQILDSGIVPLRPSSPDVVLNLAIAIVATGVGCVLYLAIAFSRQRRLVLLSYSGTR